MKNLLAAALAAVSLNAAAISGPVDGVYSCTLSAFGQSSNVYVTVNGRPDGWSVWGLPALEQHPALYGFGTGYVVGNRFSGRTWPFDLPFDMTVDGNNISGTAGLMYQGQPITVSVSCSLFF